MGQASILAHDIGTSGVKSSIVQLNGTVLDSATTNYSTLSPQANWVEQRPQDWWDGVCANTSALLERHPDQAKQIAVIGVSGHMLGCIPVDSAGTPLYNCLIHADTRASSQSDLLAREIGGDALYRLTGNTLGPHASLCKILWFRQAMPELYTRTARFLMAKDYLVSRLTGNIDTTDFSDASHGHLIDIHHKVYPEEVYRQLGLELGKMPALRSGTDIVGHLTASSAAALGLPQGIPVVAGGGDGACASMGAGISRPGDIYCSLGTTAWIAYNSATPMIDRDQRVINILSVDGGTCGVFGTMQAAGRAVQWAMELLGEPSAQGFDREAAKTPPGSDGLIFLPYLDGERSPIFDHNASGVFFGMRPTHHRGHFMRAVLEGVAFALSSILDVHRENQAFSAMRIIGGGAKSQLWRQIIADACNIPLQTLTAPSGDCTSLGVAITAGVGAGLFSSIEEGAAQIGVRETLEPNPAAVEAYGKSRQLYHQLYPQLKPVYAAAAEHGNEPNII